MPTIKHKISPETIKDDVKTIMQALTVTDENIAKGNSAKVITIDLTALARTKETFAIKQIIALTKLFLAECATNTQIQFKDKNADQNTIYYRYSKDKSGQVKYEQAMQPKAKSGVPQSTQISWTAMTEDHISSYARQAQYKYSPTTLKVDEAHQHAPLKSKDPGRGAAGKLHIKRKF